ncbi:hypothetical protein [Niveispirillum sp.]|uniref:hypothetical protein n=1 Tax=Niveispirillum sp. TaxID=1917217 RepID=UPI001B51C843|nr:hypothetical protein [Niveispirillum sp.]MBP7335873.1 hypothetical protein [Niveispirillum sp.]
MKTVTVLPFKGTDGEVFGDVLLGSLQSAKVDGVPYFEVKTLQGVTANTRSLGKDELAAAVKLGEQLGVQAVYVGTVTIARIVPQKRQEQRTRCLESGGFLKKCKQEQNYTVMCEKVVLDYAVAPQVVDVKSSKIVYSDNLTEQAYYDGCEGEVQTSNYDEVSGIEKSLGASIGALGSLFGGKKKPAADANAVPDVWTPDALTAATRLRLAERVRRHVAPYVTKVSVTFKFEAPDLAPDVKSRFKGAGEFAKAGQVEQACGRWLDLSAGANAQSSALQYNLGVCAEVQDDLPKALEFYKKAEALQDRPDKDIGDAVKRARERLANNNTAN